MENVTKAGPVHSPTPVQPGAPIETRYRVRADLGQPVLLHVNLPFWLAIEVPPPDPPMASHPTLGHRIDLRL